MLPLGLGDEGPDFVNVDDGTVVEGGVVMLVEVPHTNLAEVTGMVLVEVDSVMMLTTGITTTSGMLPVLANTTMSMGHVSSQLPGLLQSGGHFLPEILVNFYGILQIYVEKYRFH